MKTYVTAHRSRRCALTLAAALGFIGCGVVGFLGIAKPAYAVQQDEDRSVQGRVIDDAAQPIRSAIVYLSDERTKTIESYITQEDGAYRFQQLSPNDDYKLWAQLGNHKSKSKILSSFDGRSVFRVILKIDK